MGIFGKKYLEEEYLEGKTDGSFLGGSDRQEREQKLRRAKEIASGETSGMFERDEEVLDLVRKLNDE